jgi:hypothetical protein
VRGARTGETSNRQIVASAFVVRAGLVASVARYPDLAEALRAAGIDGSREVPADRRTGARGPGWEVGKL